MPVNLEELMSESVEVFYHFESEDGRLTEAEVAQIFEITNVRGYGFPNEETVNIYLTDFGGLSKLPAFIGDYKVNPICASCISAQ